jgi:flagellar assembly protein FliH
MTAARFSFETDFRKEAHGRRVTDVDVASAREQGFQDGFAQGQQAAEAKAQAALTHMAGVIARQAEALLAAQQERLTAIEAAAAALAVTMARRIAGDALADKPQALITQAARECLAHARSSPHLAARVNPSRVEETEALFGRLARESGYAGRVIVLGEPEIAPTDARFEWADGGVVIDSERLEEALAVAAETVLGVKPDLALKD